MAFVLIRAPLMTSLLRIWWRDIRVPLLLFAVLAATLAITHLDLRIAHAVFFDESQLRWVGGDSWWINEFLHTGGRWAIRTIVAAALLLWIATWLRPPLRALRRPAAYFVVTAILSVGIVGLLKTLTDVHCPWDLTDFGGGFPFMELFAPRNSTLSPGQCFPAAHASAGYALMALYFALRERSKGLGCIGLALGTFTGLMFGLAQQSRGAHFLSHDVWSAFIVWTVAASMHAFAFKGRLWNDVRNTETGLKDHEALAAGDPVGADALDLRGTRGFPWPAGG